jgi:hypothetical protein
MSDDIKKGIDSMEESGAGRCSDLVVAKKRVDAVLTLCRAYWKQEGFREAFSECDLFMTSEPKLDKLPCPDWMLHDRLKSRAGSSLLSDFWDLVDYDNLSTHCIDIDDYGSFQEEVVADKVCEIVRRESFDKVKTCLVEFASPGLAKPVDVVSKVVSDALKHIRTLAQHTDTDCDLQSLIAAVGAADDSTNKIVNAVCAFPAGRTLIQHAKARAAHLKRIASEIQVIVGHLEALDAYLPEVSAMIVDWVALAAGFKVALANWSSIITCPISL